MTFYIESVVVIVSFIAPFVAIFFALLHSDGLNQDSFTATNKFKIKQKGDIYIVCRLHSLFVCWGYIEEAQCDTLEEAFNEIEKLKSRKSKTIYKTK